MTLDEAISLCKEYYTDENIPKTVTAFRKHHPKGVTKEWLSKIGMKGSEFIALININYKRRIPAKEWADTFSIKFNFTVINYPSNKKDIFDIECNKCGIVSKTYIDKLKLVKEGCRNCSSDKLPWKEREAELTEILYNKGFNLITDISSIQNNKSRIDIICNTCNNPYNISMMQVVSRDNGCICPICNKKDNAAWGIPTMVKDKQFISKFEAYCYIELCRVFGEENIILQKKYREVFDIHNAYSCDFVINEYLWIEVSTIQLQYKKDYADRITIKRNIVESKKDYSFLFINSYEELEEIFGSVE